MITAATLRRQPYRRHPLEEPPMTTHQPTRAQMGHAVSRYAQAELSDLARAGGRAIIHRTIRRGLTLLILSYPAHAVWDLDDAWQLRHHRNRYLSVTPLPGSNPYIAAGMAALEVTR
jgi:hypothetical protein